MKLSIIIPVHNEEKFIEALLTKVQQVPISEKEMVVINDGSTDNTTTILENLKKTINFKLLSHERNLGKGAAIKTGMRHTIGDLVIIQDADLEYDPSDIALLVAAVKEDVWAVYGDRGSKKWPKRGIEYILGAKILSMLTNLLFNSKLKDVYTGYKLFNTKNFPARELMKLKSTGFEFEAEVTCKILKHRGKIVEVPISFHPRSKKEGKHIRVIDGFIGFFTILKYFFLPKQP